MRSASAFEATSLGRAQHVTFTAPSIFGERKSRLSAASISKADDNVKNRIWSNNKKNSPQRHLFWATQNFSNQLLKQRRWESVLFLRNRRAKLVTSLVPTAGAQKTCASASGPHQWEEPAASSPQFSRNRRTETKTHHTNPIT